METLTVGQRPGTAKGVTFVTLEDETGNISVIVWPSRLRSSERKHLVHRYSPCTAPSSVRARFNI
jgi:DNA polymerase III alpha subunit